MSEVGDGSVQLIVTSPAQDEFEVGVYQECFRVLRDDGAFVLNIGHPFTGRGAEADVGSDLERLQKRVEYPWLLAKLVGEITGFTLISDSMSWRHFGSKIPVDHVEHIATYDNVHEHFFIFAKSKLPKWKYAADVEKEVAAANFNIHPNIFLVNTQHLQTSTFSPWIIQWLIGDYTDEGDIVLDAQAGTAILGCVALAMGRKVVLYEKDAIRASCIEECIRGVEDTRRAGNKAMLKTDYGEYRL